MQAERQLGGLQTPMRFLDGLLGAVVPDDDGAGFILIRRDRAFEVSVAQRMVLDVIARSAGSRLGPSGTAQDTSTPSNSKRKS